MRLAPLALVMPAILAGAGAWASASSSFPVRPPEDPIPLELASPRIAVWGKTPPLRLIYYATEGQGLNALDRRTILRELKLIRDFYGHYGLIVRYEPRVYEVQGRTPKVLPALQYDYYHIKKLLESRKLLVPRRTIVFTTFDVGLGADMALTGLNNKNTARLECPRPEKGYAWWCGRPEAAHWGGSVHEVGHMLGLSHPDEYRAETPYAFASGTGTYVFDEKDAQKSVMLRHDLFFRHSDNGLLPHEVDLLQERFHNPKAPDQASAGTQF